jgi:hypothetical protein
MSHPVTITGKRHCWGATTRTKVPKTDEQAQEDLNHPTVQVQTIPCRDDDDDDHHHHDQPPDRSSQRLNCKKREKKAGLFNSSINQSRMDSIFLE